jgi:hypothetical protein
VAEGRALRRHGNRIEIIYLYCRCQLSPGTTGEHEIGIAGIFGISRLLFPLFRPGKEVSYFRRLYKALLVHSGMNRESEFANAAL